MMPNVSFFLGWGEESYNGLYGEAPSKRGYLSQDSGIRKGRDFTI